MARRGRVVVVGGGDVGARVARELVSDRSAEVTLVTARPARAEVLSESFGADAKITVRAGAADELGELDDGCGLVVLAGAPGSHPGLAAAALRRGCDVVSVSDDRRCVGALLELDGLAAGVGARLVAGAAFSPGLSCLMASFGAEGMDAVEEVHVARVGAGGARCGVARAEALRHGGREWRDGGWVATPAGSGRELTWFPDPVGARDCYVVGTAEPLLLVRRFPGLRRAVVRMAMNRRERAAVSVPGWMTSGPVTPWSSGTLGAVRVELRGERDGRRCTRVLGAIDLPAMVCGALVAHVVEQLGEREDPPGARGLGEWTGAGPLLAGLRHRGVRVATTVESS